MLERWIDNPGRDPERPPTYKPSVSMLDPSERQELLRLPGLIERLEAEVAKLKVSDRLREELKKQINAAYVRWDELEKRAEIRFEASPERVMAWEKWLAQEWQPWAKSALPKLKIQRLYGQLFALYQRLQREGEFLELLWGHGLLVWEHGGNRIRRPLLVTRMELVFDAVDGVFKLFPTEVGTILETDMLPPSLPNLDELVEWERRIRENDVDPRDAAVTEPLLTELVHILDPDGHCSMEDKIGNPTNFATIPVIYNAPVIFLRKRAGTLWQRELEGVIEALRQGASVPRPLAALVTVDGANLNQDVEGRWHATGEDLRFPLAANEEQKEIARRLAKDFGVLVQGPPGTGKSHTIVNLICHLLAHGKRVLVTSQTERALRVLGEKIKSEVPQISSLCVSVLGGDARSAKELEEAISAIAENLSSQNPELLRREVERLKLELTACRNQITALWYRLKRAAGMEHTATLEIEGRSMKPFEVAKWLTENEAEAGWFPDDLAPGTTPPLSDEQMLRLFELVGILRGEDVAAISLTRPDVTALPDVATFRQKLDELAAQEKLVATLQPYLPATEPEDNDTSLASGTIQLAKEALDRLEEFDAPWKHFILEDISSGGNRKALWVDFCRECRTHTDRLLALDKKLAGYHVAVPEGIPCPTLKEQLSAVRTRLEGGKSLGWWFRNVSGRRLSKLLDGCAVNGSPIRKTEDVDVLLLAIERKETVERLVNLWNHTLADIEGPTLNPSMSRLAANVEGVLEVIEAALRWHEELCIPLAEATKKYRPSGREKWSDPSWLGDLIKTLEAVRARQRLNSLRNYFVGLRDYLLSSSGATAKAVHGSWAQFLKALDEGDSARWESVLAELARLSRLEPLLKERKALLNRLRPVAPRWVAQILAVGGRGEPLLPPKDWRKAWTWKQAEAWLRHLQSESNVEEIENQLQAARTMEARLLSDLIAKETWLHQLSRVTEPQKRSLFAWVQAVRKIGKGTGKYADRHRQVARKEMRVARGAVPVWIMPIHRVLENFPPH